MNKIVVKKRQFSKNSVEPFTPSANPILFSLQKENIKPESSFNTELKKITAKIGPVLEKNLLKLEDNQKAQGSPFAKRARSSSPRQGLVLGQKNINLFPCGMPVVPVYLNLDEDEELKKIKQDYLKLVASVQDTKPAENEGFLAEEETYIENIIKSLSFVRRKDSFNK